MIKEDYLNRVLDIEKRLKDKSQFLFGPRQTGKSSFIKYQMKESPKLFWNLLDSRTRRKAEKDPSVLREELRAENVTNGIVIIDEIQKVPELLDEVHLLIEETDIHFLLTGSSARKLKASSVNLLGGRAWMNYIHALVYPEVKNKEYSLEHVFETGLLPAAYIDRANCESILSSYVDLYVTEEIQKEAEIRKLQPFMRFLEQAALFNTEQLNYTNIANDAGVSRDTVKSWYNILIDTLMGFELLSYKNTKKRKAIEVSKFYFFDIGVAKELAGERTPLEMETNFGKFFEQYIAQELKAYLNYTHKKDTFCYWRSTSGFEVDFIVGEKVAIETKTTREVSQKHLKGLLALKEEDIFEKYILVCREERPRLLDNGILILPFENFLDKLWRGEIV